MRTLSKLGKYTDKVFNYFVRRVSYLAAAILVAMMMITVADVFLRFALNRPILGSTEIVEFMMVSLAFLTISWCVLEKGHVRMDIFVTRFKPRVQAMFEIASYIFCLVLYVPITWRYIPETMENWRMGETSIVLQIPTHPFYFIVIIGCGMVCLALLSNLLKTLREVKKK